MARQDQTHAEGPFDRKTLHEATRDIPGPPTVADFRAMLNGTRIPNEAEVVVERIPDLPSPSYRIVAKWMTR